MANINEPDITSWVLWPKADEDTPTLIDASCPTGPVTSPFTIVVFCSSTTAVVSAYLDPGNIAPTNTMQSGNNWVFTFNIAPGTYNLVVLGDGEPADGCSDIVVIDAGGDSDQSQTAG